jgi:alpha-D-ribose 1-methylphosphonate 5-triphosphate synthase subunit PhnL
MTPALSLHGVAKSFTMHLQGAITLPIVRNVTIDVMPGECVVLGGPSGIGKSSILKMIYGNYRCDIGEIRISDGGADIDVGKAEPQRIVRLRRHTLGYVSQFLRVIPRVSALDIVSAAALEAGYDEAAARSRAADLLARLNVPERLWPLPPATFSGGEQQRVNIARGFAGRHAILLLDEPTASLDAVNRAVVVDLIREKKADGLAIFGIFHDHDVRDQIADRVLDVSAFATAQEAVP